MDAAALPFQFDSGIMECQCGEFSYCMLYSRGNDEILRLIMLQHQPHTFHVVFRIAPVSLGVQVPQI